MTELKPCPFCGGEAQLVRKSAVDIAAEAVFVECKKCGAISPIYSIPLNRIPPRAKTDSECFASVRAAWNRRTEDKE